MKPNDGRKYEVGDKVSFTDDEGQKVRGIIHGVRYQQGKYELVEAQYEDPSDLKSPIVPGTGRMELVKGTEDERHSFEYIVVREDQHKTWWDVEKANNNHVKASKHELVKPHPDLKQHIRVFVDD